MEEKRSKVEPSKKARGSNLKRRVEIRVNRDEQGLFTVKSTVPLLSILKSILRKPRYLFALLLALVVAVMALPFLTNTLTANLNIPPVVSFAFIFLALIVINPAYFAFFYNSRRRLSGSEIATV